MTHRTAVVLFNLGGPDSLATVRPFLYNLFSDPDIFRFPLGALTQKFFAWLIATSYTRSHEGLCRARWQVAVARKTQCQARALTRALAPDGVFEIFVCMRYWHPRAAEVVAELKRKGFEHVILLPLYPNTRSLPAAVPITNFNANASAPAIVRKLLSSASGSSGRITSAPSSKACGARRRRFPILTRRASRCCSPPTACRARSPTAAILTSSISARPTTRCARNSVGHTPRSAIKAVSVRSSGCGPTPRTSSARRPRPGEADAGVSHRFRFRSC